MFALIGIFFGFCLAYYASILIMFRARFEGARHTGRKGTNAAVSPQVSTSRKTRSDHFGSRGCGVLGLGNFVTIATNSLPTVDDELETTRHHTRARFGTGN